MSDEPDFPNVTRGEGYAAAHLDDLGEGYGFRRVRRGLEVQELGANALVLPPRYEAGAHRHETQEEIYFVHAGEIELELGEDVVSLGPGGVARVDAATVRRLRNVGHSDAVDLRGRRQGRLRGPRRQAARGRDPRRRTARRLSMP